ncbi:hypothetical protein NDI56_13960 [Haloarcula sp. S1CR25-12]|uniref:Uncharacterized protein n=1 Tax=Haloarcula saliterrae TaxID=2950534 RepID=A0ABU2FFD3_9EURY|nr:hypothetical protein [Haloarcula sp. S1CR25-12]MDS0260506.1 hypothetical protein [Haloarcula sp. S1CR25-12]
MEGEIEKETDKGYGVTIYDNNDAKHKIGVLYNGEINGHLQERYSDNPSERSPAGVRNVTQARHFAKYYVAKERGYPTIRESEYPHRVALATLVIAALDTESFERQFGDIYQQLKHHYDDRDPVIEIPDKLYTEDVFYQYAKDLYLGLGNAEVGELPDESMEAYLTEAEQRISDGDTADITRELTELASEHGITSGQIQTVAPSQWIVATSGLHVQWQIGDDLYGEHNDEPDIDRGPDVQLEVIPHDPDSLTDLQQYLVRHLRCQVRDIHVQMGVTPPEPFQVTGPGLNRLTDWYQRYEDAWQPYYQLEATIDWESV